MVAGSDKPESPLRQEAFAKELTTFLRRFAEEWDINRMEMAGLLFWMATAIVNSKDDEEEADSGD